MGSLAIGQGHKNKTSGDHNGMDTMQEALTTGYGNNAIGSKSQEKLTQGGIILGYMAQYKLETGYYNIGIGYAAQHNLEDGSWNIAIGNESQLETTSGNRNTSVGSRAHNNLTTGSFNVAMGREAGFYPPGGTTNSTTTGSYQTAIGSQSGQSNSTECNQLTALGFQAVAGENGTAIGARTKADGKGSVASVLTAQEGGCTDNQ